MEKLWRMFSVYSVAFVYEGRESREIPAYVFRLFTSRVCILLMQGDEIDVDFIQVPHWSFVFPRVMTCQSRPRAYCPGPVSSDIKINVSSLDIGNLGSNQC